MRLLFDRCPNPPEPRAGSPPAGRSQGLRPGSGSQGLPPHPLVDAPSHLGGLGPQADCERRAPWWPSQTIAFRSRAQRAKNGTNATFRDTVHTKCPWSFRTPIIRRTPTSASPPRHDLAPRPAPLGRAGGVQGGTFTSEAKWSPPGRESPRERSVSRTPGGVGGPAPRVADLAGPDAVGLHKQEDPSGPPPTASRPPPPTRGRTSSSQVPSRSVREKGTPRSTPSWSKSLTSQLDEQQRILKGEDVVRRTAVRSPVQSSPFRGRCRAQRGGGGPRRALCARSRGGRCAPGARRALCARRSHQLRIVADGGGAVRSRGPRRLRGGSGAGRRPRKAACSRSLRASGCTPRRCALR